MDFHNFFPLSTWYEFSKNPKTIQYQKNLLLGEIMHNLIEFPAQLLST